MTAARLPFLKGIARSSHVASKMARAIAAGLLAWAPCGPAPGGDEPPTGDAPAAEAPSADGTPQPPLPPEVEARLERIETRLEGLEEKLDRLEALLRMVHAERLRRAEMLAADPALAAAVRAVEERWGVARADEHLIADDVGRVAALAKNLARASAEAGPAAFCSDPDVARVVAAIADRRDYMAEGGRRLVVSISGAKAEAAGALVSGLLDIGSENAREAALWAAPFAAGEGLAGRLSKLAAGPAEGDARLLLLARAAAAVHGDAAAEEGMAELLRPGAVDGAPGLGIAENLLAAGSSVALRVYLELVLDEKHAYAAAQAFSAVDGFGRRIGWREVSEGREGLHDELADWLRRNRARLRFDRGRFRVETEKGKR